MIPHSHIYSCFNVCTKHHIHSPSRTPLHTHTLTHTDTHMDSLTDGSSVGVWAQKKINAKQNWTVCRACPACKLLFVNKHTTHLQIHTTVPPTPSLTSTHTHTHKHTHTHMGTTFAEWKPCLQYAIKAEFCILTLGILQIVTKNLGSSLWVVKYLLLCSILDPWLTLTREFIAVLLFCAILFFNSLFGLNLTFLKWPGQLQHCTLVVWLCLKSWFVQFSSATVNRTKYPAVIYPNLKA